MKEDAKLAQELYNKHCNKYSTEQAQHLPVQNLKTEINYILGQIKNKKILFAGCGDGLECTPSIEKGGNVVGIDVSDNIIKLAKKNCKNAEFYVMDFEHTTFERESFDIIVSINAIMYKENLTVVLKELGRILKKNGYILLAVPHPVRKMVKYNKLNYFVKGRRKEVWKGTRRFNYYRLFEDYVTAFVESGLKITKVAEPKPYGDEVSSKDANHPHFLIIRLVKEIK